MRAIYIVIYVQSLWTLLLTAGFEIAWSLFGQLEAWQRLWEVGMRFGNVYMYMLLCITQIERTSGPIKLSPSTRKWTARVVLIGLDDLRYAQQRLRCMTGIVACVIA